MVPTSTTTSPCFCYARDPHREPRWRLRTGHVCGGTRTASSGGANRLLDARHHRPEPRVRTRSPDAGAARAASGGRPRRLRALLEAGAPVRLGRVVAPLSYTRAARTDRHSKPTVRDAGFALVIDRIRCDLSLQHREPPSTAWPFAVPAHGAPLRRSASGRSVTSLTLTPLKSDSTDSDGANGGT